MYTSARDVAQLNALDEARFVALLGGVFEHSPWVARQAWRDRPFASVDALLRSMRDAVGDAEAERQLALMRAHPELAGREAEAGLLLACCEMYWPSSVPVVESRKESFGHGQSGLLYVPCCRKWCRQSPDAAYDNSVCRDDDVRK